MSSEVLNEKLNALRLNMIKTYFAYLPVLKQMKGKLGYEFFGTDKVNGDTLLRIEDNGIYLDVEGEKQYVLIDDLSERDFIDLIKAIENKLSK